MPFLILFAALLCGTTTSAIADSAGLRAAIDAAWARQPRAAAFEARAGVVQAREEAVRAPFAGPPSLTLSHRTDELTGNRGKREFEAGISAPVWIGPERAARIDVLAHERQEIDAATKLARWKVAGEVRAALWQAAEAREHAAAAARRTSALERLLADIERRVSSGESARIDSLAARGELETARMARAGTDAVAHGAMARWRILTGLPELPALDAEPQHTAPPLETHPEWHDAEALLARAKADARLAAAARNDAPEIGIAARTDQDAFGTGYRQNLRFEVRIPFATDARNRPRVAAAQAALAAADADTAQRRFVIENEIAQAQALREAARAATTHADLRVAAAREAHALITKAYDLGEIPVATRLRTEQLLHEAESAAAIARIGAAATQARLNQSLGVIP